MFTIKKVPIEATGVLNNLVKDYINESENVKPYYSNYFDLNGFESRIGEAEFKQDRGVLVSRLMSQSALVNNTHQATLSNIQLLNNSNAYTITTGHQLCLNTGPLYFIYKILSVIKTCQLLKQQFPTTHFVPVYWMAAEDHDFEEVNHFNLYSKVLTWNSQQTGSVGEFETKELTDLFGEYATILGDSENGVFLKDLFKEAYLNHKQLKDATRYLVNALFGKYGLVVVNGNDEELKKQFAPFLEKDIFDNTPAKSVNKTIQSLSEGNYIIQVKPREINCFYTEKGLRARIEKKENGFSVVGTDKTFSETELRELIHNNAVSISPNVVLRPLYQQVILPNLAYIGGPGELAYWLEYKEMFDELGVSFPILMPRSFVTVLDKNNLQKLGKLAIESENIFKSEAELIEIIQKKKGETFDLSETKTKIESIYSSLAESINEIDKSLKNSVLAEMQKASSGLSQLEGKANKALKQRIETEINQIKNVKAKLFPNHLPQERFENFSGFYLAYGDSFFTELLNAMNPFDPKMLILKEV